MKKIIINEYSNSFFYILIYYLISELKPVFKIPILAATKNPVNQGMK
jgi:hypothetical protein